MASRRSTSAPRRKRPVPARRRPRRRPLHTWAAISLVVAVPLAFDPGGYFMFLPLKWVLASAGVAAGRGASIADQDQRDRTVRLAVATS